MSRDLGYRRFMYSKDNLRKLKKMDSLAPDVMKAFWAFDKAALADGAIPVKYKELIAVAEGGWGGCVFLEIEFAGFRFDESRLHHFHEHIVAPALHAMLDCDIPTLAQIDGACIGGGLEIAACCDIRVCGQGSRFGAPIAKLGFPMAPSELQVLRRVVAAPVLREMLLEARLLDATTALRLGRVHEVVGDEQVPERTAQRADALTALSPQAARINKRTLRQLEQGGPSPAERRAHFGYAAVPTTSRA